MAEAKWLKIRVDMYDHPKLKIIDDMEDKNLIHYIWTSSLLLAGRCNRSGELYLSDDMPYTIKTLSIVFRRTEEEVKEAYKVLKKLKMIVVTEDRAFKIKNWDKYQNVDSLEKIRKQTNERVAKYREKKREEKRAEEEQKKVEENDEQETKCIDKDENYSVNSSEDDLDNKENTHIKSSNEEDYNDDTYDKFEINNSNVTCNDEVNATCNKLSVTETQQNKKENKSKIENKNENEKENKSKIENKNENRIEDKSKTENKNRTEKERDNNKSVSVSEDIYSKSIELAQYCERITGKVGILDNHSLNMVIDMHGSENVKKAIQKAVEQGKVNMRYINGILKNWRKEGYPNDDIGGKVYGEKCNNKGNEPDTNKLRDFKPKEPRKLSEEERNRASANVI